MALHLTAVLAAVLAAVLTGHSVASQVQRMLEYEPEPPQLVPTDWSGVNVAAARAAFRETLGDTLADAPALRGLVLAVAG